MPYTQILYHIVFRPKDSQPVINETYERDLFAYLVATCRNMNCHVHRINAMPDHIHLLVSLHPMVPLADFVRTIKIASGRFMKSQAHHFPLFTEWARGYCAITHSIKQRDVVIEYIKNQKEHHRKISFAEEFKKLLEEYHIDYEEKYLPK